MTVEAANAFLKLLEEPPDDTVIVMTTSRLYALLPTIRSRCEEIRFSPLPLEQLREILGKELDVPPDQADQLSRNSEGSLGKAVWMYKQGGKGGWDDAWELFQLAVHGTEGDRLEYVAGGALKGDRERVRSALEVLVSLLRDLIALTYDMGEKDVINVSRFGLLEVCDEVPVGGAIRTMKRIEELRKLLDRNINTSILLWRLLHNLSMDLKTG
jgi:DNA polymerase-3 subunit delta'